MLHWTGTGLTEVFVHLKHNTSADWSGEKDRSQGDKALRKELHLVVDTARCELEERLDVGQVT
jgi:hypothetical protein